LQWSVEPLAIRRVESSFFADASLFPPGAVQFDCALLMRHIPHEWRGVETLTCCPASVGTRRVESAAESGISRAARVD
jgi:hypothetical protein